MDAIDGDIEARLLGKFSLTAPDGASLLPKYRKSRGVLAYLLYHHGRPIRRTMLADLFWSDRDLRQGLASLRQSVSEIRAALGSLRDVLIDARRAEITLHGQRLRFDLWDETRTLVATAEGTLLDGLDPVSPVFDEWLFGERRDMDRRRIAALENVLAAKRADPEPALTAALQILRLDARHETAARTAMKLLAERGQMSKAIQIYADIEAALRADGFALDAETRKLYQMLQRQTGAVQVIVPASRAEQAPSVAVSITSAAGAEAVRDLGPVLHLRLSAVRGFRFTPAEEEPEYTAHLRLQVHAGWLAAQVIVQHQPSRQTVATAELAADADSGQSAAGLLADKIAAAVVNAITEDQTRSLDTAPQENWGAYRHYLRGRMLALAARDSAGMLAAEQHLERAIGLQPDFVLPYPWLVTIYNSARGNTIPGMPREPGLARALTMVRRLLLLDDGYSAAHLTFCWCLIRMQQFDLAAQSLENAITRAPSDPLQLSYIGRAWMYLGELERAASFHEQARQRIGAPLSRLTTDLGELAYLQRDYATALQHFDAESQNDPIRARILRAATLARLGHAEEAEAGVRAAEAWFQNHWQGLQPYTPEAAIQWYAEDFAFKRAEDRDNIREGLSAAGFAI